MIKHIIDTTQKIMEGNLSYQTFTKELAANSDFVEQDKQKIKLLINALLNRYYRYAYSISGAEISSYSTQEILAISLFSFNLEKPVMSLSYEAVLSALPAESQVRVEEDFPESSFPIKIPLSFQKDNLALSFAARFSLPLHLVERLIGDIGKKNILKFLASRLVEKTGIVNTSLISSEELFKNNKDFIAGKLANEFVYTGKDFVKKTQEYINNQIILTTQSMLDIAHLIDDMNPKSILFAQHEDTSLMLLISLLYPQISIHYTATEPKAKFILQHLVRKFDLKNIVYINAIAQTYDLVLTTLTSSNINGNIRHRDFYFRLEPSLETYVLRAKEELSGLKDYVNETGSLIFVSTTALRAETHYQALSFINENPEFVLLKEKQFYHFNELQETVYYALFKKGSNAE